MLRKILMRDIKNKLFCAALIMQPLLRLYGLPIGGTFADYALMLVVLSIVLKSNREILQLNRRTKVLELVPIMICVMVNIFFTWNSSFGVGNQIEYWIRYVLYYFVLICGIKDNYSTEYGYNIYKILAIVSTVFLIIQSLASSLLGLYIPGQFGPFALTDITSQYERYNLYSGYNLFRPDSFFSEPAHYATFVSGFVLLCSLQDINRKNIMLMLFCTLGILISGSTTGLAITVFIWFLWIARILQKKNKIKYLIPIVLLSILAMSIVVRTNSFQVMLMRTFKTQNALNSRFDWIETFDVLKTPMQYLFGIGNSSDVIELTGWIPGWMIILVSYGIIGVILYIISYFLLFLYSDKNGKIILLYIIIMGFGTELVADIYVLVLLPFVINKISIMNTTRKKRPIRFVIRNRNRIK